MFTGDNNLNITWNYIDADVSENYICISFHRHHDGILFLNLLILLLIMQWSLHFKTTHSARETLS